MSKPFYGQNRDDFYIWSVIAEQNLQDIPRRCVEIGACDGKFLSNTRAFAEDGWETWLVEPCPKWLPALRANCQEVPNARAVHAAIADYDGEIGFLVDERVPDHSFTVAVPKPVHALTGQMSLRVPCLTYRSLMSLLNGSGEIGLLSIDTEGMDTGILRQMLDCVPYPWFVIVESLRQSDRREQIVLLSPHYHLLNVLDLNCVWVRRDIAARWIEP